MTTKKPKLAGEIDAWCRRCNLDLNHRITKILGEKVLKVECMTCRWEHAYVKNPKAAAAVRADGKGGGEGAERVRAPRRQPAERVDPAAERARELLQAWEGAIAGKPATAFKAYRTTQTFTPGELLRHPKFGDGVVARVIDRGKMEVLFRDGPRTMAQGLEG